MAHENAVILALCCMMTLLVQPAASSRPPKFPALFAFGDSTVDPGNNNHIATLFRANHLPYGRAMPDHVASGRFSDGKLATDYISSACGVSDMLPAYLDPSLTDADLLGGASFGSAGTGLDRRTVELSNVLDLATQIGYFEEALMRMRKLVGERKADEIVKKGLFVISVGTNDLLFNLPTRMLELSVSGYHDLLLRNLQDVIKRLYKKGARKIIVVGVPPIGCLPLQMTVGSLIPREQHMMLESLCNQRLNNETQSYNNKTQALISSVLQPTLKDAKIAYFDVYAPIFDMVTNPSKYGFEVTNRGCCGSGLMEMGPMCNFLSPLCSDASKFLFWDCVHLTQAAYSMLANNSAKALLPHLAN